jgi:hypothetical protein
LQRKKEELVGKLNPFTKPCVILADKKPPENSKEHGSLYFLRRRKNTETEQAYNQCFFLDLSENESHLS